MSRCAGREGSGQTCVGRPGPGPRAWFLAELKCCPWGCRAAPYVYFPPSKTASTAPFYSKRHPWKGASASSPSSGALGWALPESSRALGRRCWLGEMLPTQHGRAEGRAGRGRGPTAEKAALLPGAHHAAPPVPMVPRLRCRAPCSLAAPQGRPSFLHRHLKHRKRPCSTTQAPPVSMQPFLRRNHGGSEAEAFSAQPSHLRPGLQEPLGPGPSSRRFISQTVLPDGHRREPPHTSPEDQH